ncbi:DUF1206 domain-containing protein [Planktothrix sp. FACHB-1355]|uniref:DUF1206 domain-containing protein n=1 Tax=Aerosakkonema funiforme FACHB-1375 TaxID=2949571 RepID=A0A926VI06_9CYAN|nr:MULTISPECIES: DUF1206 domain-containing protein [Oscillatoriales]MBD2184157.1 DUF1206 domain-containing protein [Aerosakkonema funiforme FACHB-1375]MBD3562131.1 DUF1206 domain-containing protein [Planktothrix sp. FACHB-1355]
MTRQNLPNKNVETAARQAAAHPWVERLARFGIAAKGVVYAIVGVLAAQAAFGAGGRTTDSKGALQTIVTQPFGKFLLGLVAIGLVGYVVWRFVQAFLDPERKGSDAKGIAQRIGYFISGLIYAGLALTATKIILGSASGGGSNSTQHWTARLLAQPFGQWLVATVGVIIIGIACYQIYKAFTGKFRQELKWQEMRNVERTWAMRLGRFGLTAQAIVFSIIGFFLIQAARQSDPNQARSLGGALAALAEQPYGPWVLGVVAIGLVAYGIYMMVQARYRRVVTV